MKKVLLALAGAALLAWVGLALADYNVVDQGTYYKNAQSGAKVDATGNGLVTEASKDRDNWRLIPLLNNQLGASGSAMIDSVTTPVATYDFSRMNLLLRGNFDSLSTEVRIAVQIRGHYSQSTDTSSTFPWFRWPAKNLPAIPVTVTGVLGASGSAVLHTALSAGSLGAFTPVPLGYVAVGGGIPVGTYIASKGTGDSAATLSTTLSQPLNGSVTFYPPAASGGFSRTGFGDVDSVGHLTSGSYALAQVTTANTSNNLSTGMWSGEFMVKFNVARTDSANTGNGKYGGSPANNMLIPLVDGNGAWFNAPYTSIRVRVLNGVRSRFRLRADLMGVSK